MRTRLRVGACQTPEILGDLEAALRCVEEFAQKARAEHVDLLLFPECFLQGYLVEPEHVERHALDFTAPPFQEVLKRLESVQPTLVVGVIERSGTAFFNSAVVVSRGILQGVYRKTHLTAGERLFQPGAEYPTFQLSGVRFGINVCYDTNFPEAAHAVAAQGATLLLVPSQNMMRRQDAETWKDRHNAVRGERVRETGLWLASADVTGQRDDSRIAYGPTCIMAPDGTVVEQVPAMSVGMAVADIPPTK